jgi:antitoxin Phd
MNNNGYNKSRMNLSYFYFGDDNMMINTDTMFSMTQANQNFSSVARSVDKNGEAVVLKNNKPKYLVVDMENEDFILDLTEEERIDIVTKRVLKKYLPAFKELAK